MELLAEIKREADNLNLNALICPRAPHIPCDSRLRRDHRGDEYLRDIRPSRDHGGGAVLTLLRRLAAYESRED